MHPAEGSACLSSIRLKRPAETWTVPISYNIFALTAKLNVRLVELTPGDSNPRYKRNCSSAELLPDGRPESNRRHIASI